MYFTRSELLLEGGGVIGERGCFVMTGGGGGGGATFFGIFFKLLIETAEVVVLFDDELTLGDDSRFILIFGGDLFEIMGSVLIRGFCGGLFVGVCIGFFNEVWVFAFDGDGIGSFFLIVWLVGVCVTGFASGSGFTFTDGRGLDIDRSKQNTFIGINLKDWDKDFSYHQ